MELARVGRMARAAAAVLAILAVVGGLAWAGRRPVRVPLDAGPLQPFGLLAGGSFGFTAPTGGGVYYLGLAPLGNRSSESIRVLDFHLAHTSPNVHELGHRLYSAEQFGAVVTGYDPADPDPSIDFEHARPLSMPYVIPAHAESSRFAMIEVRLTAFPPPAFASGCVVTYQLGSSSERYVLVYDCTYYFGESAQDYFDGRTMLKVVNLGARRIQLLDCGICGSRGVRLEGDTGFLGWEVGPGDSRSVTAVVDGRRVECRPPTGKAAKAYAAMHGPDLTYDITQKGTCVVPQ